MKAILCPRYGPPEILRFEEVSVPEPGPYDVLVRVYAAGVSISDCVVRSGRVKPVMWLPFRIFVGFRGPRNPILGLDLSGEVWAVGSKVTRWQPGDMLLAFTGRRFGAYAEFACLREDGRYMPSECVMTRKPRNISHAEAATVPSRAMLALHFLDEVDIQVGQRVLIYGASGGVGVFAVQLASHLGAEVTAVCGPRHLDLVRSLGAAYVLDYTREDNRDFGGAFDVVFDAVGVRKQSALKAQCLAAIKPRGKISSVDRAVKISAARLDTARQLIEDGVMRPVVDRTYPLEQTAEAHRYVELGHKVGGVAIEIRSS
jgi:NADPH:quinone reductase-like Zn-dependent oxidoreductase